MIQDELEVLREIESSDTGAVGGGYSSLRALKEGAAQGLGSSYWGCRDAKGTFVPVPLFGMVSDSDTRVSYS